MLRLCKNDYICDTCCDVVLADYDGTSSATTVQRKKKRPRWSTVFDLIKIWYPRYIVFAHFSYVNY